MYVYIYICCTCFHSDLLVYQRVTPVLQRRLLLGSNRFSSRLGGVNFLGDILGDFMGNSWDFHRIWWYLLGYDVYLMGSFIWIHLNDHSFFHSQWWWNRRLIPPMKIRWFFMRFDGILVGYDVCSMAVALFDLLWNLGVHFRLIFNGCRLRRTIQLGRYLASDLLVRQTIPYPYGSFLK